MVSPRTLQSQCLAWAGSNPPTPPPGVESELSQGSERRVGLKAQAIHLEHRSSSPPALVISQAMAFGHLQCKHSDPGIAVDLVKQMFTLELKY